MFSQLLVSSNSRKNLAFGFTMPAAALLHASALGTILLIPLLFPAALPFRLDADSVMILPSYEPSRPPLPLINNGNQSRPAAQQTHAQTQIKVNSFYQPKDIPDQIPPPRDTDPSIFDNPNGNDSGGIGVPGGRDLGRDLSNQNVVTPVTVVSTPIPHQPPPPPPVTPARVTSQLLSARLIKQVDPVYPELARAAHIEGVVILQITVGTDGRVSNIRLVTGNPLLTRAAEDAVSQWVYTPTILNGEPIPVMGTVMVRFILNSNR